MDAMISLQCSSSEKIAKELNSFLRNKGYTTWICIEMTGGATYREEIVVNASGSKVMIALMNVKWAESKECRYEFNIALRSQLTKGFPQIIPVMLETFDFNAYPLITGVMANTNAIFFNRREPNATWAQVLLALSAIIKPSSPDVKVPTTPLPVQVQSKLPENISEWDTEHVGIWFQSLKLPQSNKEMLESNWIDGPLLLEMKQEEMVESLKLTGLQAKRLAREINALVLASSPSTPSSSSSSSNSGQLTARSIDRLQSNKGFATGIWEGFFEYDSGRKGETSMDVTMIAGVVAGYGSDSTGDFLVQGTYNDNDLSIYWDKQYIGQHTVAYTGKLVAKTIKGTWKISDSWNGKFELTFKKKA